ncbi:MAG: hypothetical protein GY757_21560 [bacterium]|nr:hypothetical protein [bacterium]
MRNTKDIKRIKDLEKSLGITLMEIPFDKIVEEVNGYSVDEKGRVTGLNLYGFGLYSLPPLQGLENLTTLDLRDNQLTDITSLQGLENLITLNLGGNGLADVSALQGLKKLTFLELSYNRIEVLPESFVRLDMKIEMSNVFKGEGYIHLYGNPLKHPPIEILKQGKKNILAYYQSLKEGPKRPLNEVKVLLLGEGGAGKTSLANRLMENTFNENLDQTHGIDIRTWSLQPPGTAPVTVNLWDFGGLEVQHAPLGHHRGLRRNHLQNPGGKPRRAET